jgi:signal peptidase
MFSALGNPRQALSQILNFGLILSTAFMMWKGLSVVTDSPSPIVVVLSGSMEPAFQRGDLLFLWNRNIVQETQVGEIVVYNVRGKDIPIVHRVVRKFGEGYVLSSLHCLLARVIEKSKSTANLLPDQKPSCSPKATTT